MKLILICLLAGSFLFAKGPEEDVGFAVVELFTSQGCSGCPPADDLLAQLDAEAEDNIYTLSFHVTHWDHLGWRDPYARESYNQRHEDYAGALKDKLYTPQMVINGQHSFSGSDERTARATIDAVLKVDPEVSVYVDEVVGKRRVKVNYSLEGDIRRLDLNIAVVERWRENNINRGENKGRQSGHVNVVRVMKTVRAKESGTVTLRIPDDLDPSDLRLFVYVQDPGERDILGASEASIWIPSRPAALPIPSPE